MILAQMLRSTRNTVAEATMGLQYYLLIETVDQLEQAIVFLLSLHHDRNKVVQRSQASGSAERQRICKSFAQHQGQTLMSSFVTKRFLEG